MVHLGYSTAPTRKFKNRFVFFFQAAVVSILLYGCTPWTLKKPKEKKFDGNYSRMVLAILNKSGRRHPSKERLYGHLPPISKTIQVRRNRHPGHCWWSRDELMSEIPLWTPSRGRANSGRPVKTYIQGLCADTGYDLEDLPEALDDREVWPEWVRYIQADGATWRWWWWWWWYNEWPSSCIVLNKYSNKNNYFSFILMWQIQKTFSSTQFYSDW